MAALAPDEWPCGNTAPVLIFEDRIHAWAGLAVLNSMVFDWLVRQFVFGLHLNKFYLHELSWPRISVEQQAILSTSAAALSACIRTPSVSPQDLDWADSLRIQSVQVEILAHLEIERIVATSFGLTNEMLARIFSPARSDRRGFWRCFDADPMAREVPRQLLSGSPPPRPRKRAA